MKALYKDFSKIMLKIKFENLSNTNVGNYIKEKTLFQECLNKKIPKDKWGEFIKNEIIKNQNAYIKTSNNNEMYNI